MRFAHITINMTLTCVLALVLPDNEHMKGAQEKECTTGRVHCQVQVPNQSDLLISSTSTLLCFIAILFCYFFCLRDLVLHWKRAHSGEGIATTVDPVYSKADCSSLRASAGFSS